MSMWSDISDQITIGLIMKRIRIIEKDIEEGKITKEYGEAYIEGLKEAIRIIGTNG